MKLIFILITFILATSCSDPSDSSSLVVGDNQFSEVNNSAYIKTVSVSNQVYSDSDKILFLVNYSKNVTVTGTPNLALDINGSSENAAYVSGSGTNSLTFEYTVQNTDEDLDGIEILNLLTSSASLKDESDADASIILPTTDTSNVLIKSTTASITSTTTSGAKTYINNETIDITLNFSENVIVTGTPSLEVVLDSATTQIPYVAGSGTNALTFSYTISLGDADADGIVFNQLNLNSGAIKDVVGKDANLTFALDLSSHLIDTGVPTIDSLLINSGETYTNSTSATLNLTSTDATQMYITSDSSCNTGGTLEAFATSKVITLTDNVLNTVYVKVVDTNGNESLCQSATITHDSLAPNAIGSISIAGDASDIASDTSSWAIVSDNGPSGVQTYEFAVSTTTDESGIITGGSWADTLNQTSYQINSGIALANATDYYTLVRAVDNAGNKSAITASASWSIIVSPEIVANLEASNRTVDSITLGWSYPNDNGTPITDYQIQIKGGSYADFTLLNDGVSTSTSAVISSLDADTSYQFKIRAFNGVNYSGWSNTLTSQTLPNIDFFQGGFKAINISGAPKSKLVSFEDNNDIYIDKNFIKTMSKGEIYAFDSTDFMVVEASKAFYVAGRIGTGTGSNNQANATWTTQAWVGKEFYFNLTRTSPLRVKVYAFTDSNITIKTGATTVATQSLTAENGHTFTLTNYANYQLTSTGFVAVFTYGNQSGGLYDPQPQLPISTDILGFPSSKAKVTSGVDSNNYTAYHSNGTQNTGTMNASTTLSLNPQGNSKLYQSESLRIISNSPITANSNADSDGYCQAPFVPVSMLKSKFGINTDSEWVAFASDRPVTITITKPDNTTSTLTLTRSGSGKTPYKGYINSGLVAGTLFEGSDKFQAWYQPYNSTHSAGDDETIMFGWD